MDAKRILCDVSFAIPSAKGFQGLSEPYLEEITTEDYLKYFAQKAKDSYPDAHTIIVERLSLTRHDEQGKYLITDKGVVEKEMIWENPAL